MTILAMNVFENKIDAIKWRFREMYMLTKGKSNMPLIKLSEGVSADAESSRRFVTIVTGSQGEKVKPVKIWKKPFVFFKKELLDAEFVSKTELVELRLYFNNQDDEARVVIKKFKIPLHMVGNVSFSEDIIKKSDPVTVTLASVKLKLTDDANTTAFNMEYVCGGCFIEATKAVIAKANAVKRGENELTYYREVK